MPLMARSAGLVAAALVWPLLRRPPDRNHNNGGWRVHCVRHATPEKGVT